MFANVGKETREIAIPNTVSDVFVEKLQKKQ